MNLTRVMDDLVSESKNFVNRHVEIEMLQNVYSGNTEGRSRSVLVTGVHRIGKTLLSLIFAQNLLEEHPERLYYIDFQRTIFPSESSYIHFLARELGMPDLKLSDESITWWLYLRRIFRQISELPKDSIIILDEVEALLEFWTPVQFIHFLRAFALPERKIRTKHQTNIPMIIVITRRDWALLEWDYVQDSPLLDRACTLQVGKLGDAAILQLARNCFGNAAYDRKSFTKLLDWVISLAGGHPYIVYRTVDIANNYNELNEIRIEDLANDLLSKCNAYFRSIWLDLSPTEQEHVALAILGKLKRTEHIGGEHRKSFSYYHGRRYLAKRGILEESGDSTFSPLFSWWVAQNASEYISEQRKSVRREFDITKLKTLFETLNTGAVTMQTFSAFLNTLGNIIP